MTAMQLAKFKCQVWAAAVWNSLVVTSLKCNSFKRFYSEPRRQETTGLKLYGLDLCCRWNKTHKCTVLQTKKNIYFYTGCPKKIVILDFCVIVYTVKIDYKGNYREVESYIQNMLGLSHTPLKHVKLIFCLYANPLWR